MRTIFRAALLFVFALVVAGQGWTQYYHIDFSAFPADAAYRKQVADFFSIYKYVNHWTPEWKYDLPKDKATSLLEALLEATSDRIAGEKGGGLDLALFRGLLRGCLYNLDSGNHFKTNVAELEKLAGKYPKDYRVPWLLADFLVHAGNCFDGLRQYDYIFENIFLDRLAADVVLDYCAAALLAMMPAHCVNVVDNLAADNNISDPQTIFPLYDDAKGQLREPPVGVAIANKEIYSFFEREHGSGFLCRLFGAWLPMKDDWSVRPLDVRENGSGGMAVTVPLKSERGRAIKVTFLGLFQAQPRETFDEYVKNKLKNFNDITPYSPDEGKRPFQAFEIRDPNMYRENGGAHGFVVMLERSQPKVKGLSVEAPSRIPQGNRSGAHYFQDKGGYTRFDGDIYYYFLLDSCEAVFEQSKKEFFDFLDQVLLD